MELIAADDDGSIEFEFSFEFIASILLFDAESVTLSINELKFIFGIELVDCDLAFISLDFEGDEVVDWFLIGDDKLNVVSNIIANSIENVLENNLVSCIPKAVESGIWDILKSSKGTFSFGSHKSFKIFNILAITSLSISKHKIGLFIKIVLKKDFLNYESPNLCTV